MSLKLIFMGTPEFAVPILKSINNSEHKILSVYTQPPKKSKRGQKINLSPVHKYSNQLKIEVRHPFNLEDEKEIKYFKELCPDVVVVAAYGKILPSKLLNIGDSKFINVHASLLPRWRAAPIKDLYGNGSTNRYFDYEDRSKIRCWSLLNSGKN